MSSAPGSPAGTSSPVFGRCRHVAIGDTFIAHRLVRSATDAYAAQVRRRGLQTFFAPGAGP